MSWESEVRAQFPQLKRTVNGKRLVYLDSGATTLKPLPVIEAVRDHLALGAANVHRGAHALSDEATGKYEAARETVRAFVGADHREEIIFTRGTTESINLVAATLGRKILGPGDEILISQMEHHSNIVPWQMVALERGAKVRFVPILDDGTLDYAAFEKMLSAKTKIVSLVWLSNALGTINPLAKFFAAAHKAGAYTVADAAQAVSLLSVNVKELGADFLAFSGHKIFGPTGVGVLYGRKEILETLPPYQGGGSMISEVTEEGVTFLGLPHRFEAGTPAVAEILGLAEALKFVTSIGIEQIQKHEREIVGAAEEGLKKIGGFRQFGGIGPRGHILSFVLEGSHPSDVGAILDQLGIAIRAGHHCCQPLMKRLGVPGTARASFSIYSTAEDVQDLLNGLRKAKEMLS